MDAPPSNSVRTNRDFYDHISHAYDLLADAGEHRARQTGERDLAVQQGERVLEIGFGTGNSLIDLANATGDTGGVTGIDISRGMLEVARKKIEQAGLSSRVDLRIADARSLPLEDNTFDAAFTSFTLELFPLEDIPKVLAEVARVLKVGGRLGVVSMALAAANERDSALEKTYKWMHVHFPHIVDCQPIDVNGFVRGAKLDIVHQTNMTIWTMPVAAIVARKLA